MVTQNYSTLLITNRNKVYYPMQISKKWKNSSQTKNISAK